MTKKGSPFLWGVGIAIVVLMGVTTFFLVRMNAPRKYYHVHMYCMANLHSIRMGIGLYQCECDDLQPLTLNQLVERKLISPKTLSCPRMRWKLNASEDPSDSSFGIDYVLISGLEGLEENMDPSFIQAFELPINDDQHTVGLLYTLRKASQVKRECNNDNFLKTLQDTNDYIAKRRSE